MELLEKKEDFIEIKKNNVGVILITDSTTGNHVHIPSCSFVTESNYEEKSDFRK